MEKFSSPYTLQQGQECNLLVRTSSCICNITFAYISPTLFQPSYKEWDNTKHMECRSAYIFRLCKKLQLSNGLIYKHLILQP